MKILFILLIVVVKIVSEKVFIIDYCDSIYCQDNTSFHTACNNTGKFASSCPDKIKLVKLSKSQKKLLVDVHNKYRAEIAKGSVVNKHNETFPPAAEMNEIIWDETQAYMASLHLKSCQISHDECKNTAYDFEEEDLTLSGQSIFIVATNNSKRQPLEEYLKKAVYEWNIEYLHTPLDALSKVYLIQEEKTGHFLQIAHDQNKEFGCAVVTWDRPIPEEDLIEKSTRITCNYRKSPYGGESLYTFGPTGSLCQSKDEGCRNEGLCMQFLDSKCEKPSKKD